MEELVEGESERGSRIREVELTQGGLELADADVVVEPWLPSAARGGVASNGDRPRGF